MRILHMIPDIGVANGVMSVILNYAKAMPDDIKFDVVYFHETENNRKKDIEALGGQVFKIGAPGISTLKNKDIQKLFDQNPNRWSALHIHAPHFAIFIAPVAKRHGIDKIAVHCHSTWYSFYKTNQLRNKLLFNLGKPFTTQNFACGKEAGEFWYGNDNYFELPNAVDCKNISYNEQKRSEKRAQLGLEGKFVVGHLGRVHPPQKNHKFLLEIFSKVKELEPSSVLLMVGAEEDNELLQFANQLGVDDSIQFLGARTDVPDLLQAFDVFLFPSLWEGLPVSVVEAQASGLGVVMADTVTKEVCVTDKITLLSLNDDAQIWAQKVLEYGKLERKDVYSVMKTSGWDIYAEAEKLANYYKNGELK